MKFTWLLLSSTKTKIQLVLAVILAAAFLGSGISYPATTTIAETYADEQFSAEYLQSVFTEIDPFVAINDDKSLTFDQEAALKSGVDPDDVIVGIEFTEIQNKLMILIKEDGFGSAKIDKQQIKKFEPFFERVATETGLSISPSSNSSLLEFVCGGGPDSPHPCPDPVNSTIFYTTRGGIEYYLESQGYHQTYPYAGDIYDWTLGCGHFGCSSPTFRTHARVFTTGGLWTYWTQHPEPNPEILNYSWPAYWWGSYVYWWHTEYC
jgi:hypothetical protein